MRGAIASALRPGELAKPKLTLLRAAACRDPAHNIRSTSVVKSPTLTTGAGNPVPDNQNSITAGPRGPVLMQDFYLLEKLAHQNRERIPERTVHAKGSAAFVRSPSPKDIAKYTKAKVFSKVGKTTEAFLRFSTVAGERGAADAERDVRGFALRFYTDEGNWDLVGNNTPSSSCAILSSSLISSIPRNGTRRPTCARTPRCGISGLSARKPAPGYDPDVGPRPAAELSQHPWVRIAHLLVHQCRG